MARVNVYSPAGCGRYLSRTPDNVGHVLDYASQKDYMTPGEPFDPKDAAAIIKDLDQRFPLSWLANTPVFLAPGQLHVYGPDWTGRTAHEDPFHALRIHRLTLDDEDEESRLMYNGVAYLSHIVIGARLNANLAMTITHEIGHALTYLFIDSIYTDKKHSPAFLQYLRLRGLDPVKYGYGPVWERRGWEEFAQAFACLAGDEATRLEAALWYREVGLPLPGSEIMAWMRGLIAYLDAAPGSLQVGVVDWSPRAPEPPPAPSTVYTVWLKLDADGKWKAQMGAFNVRDNGVRFARQVEASLVAGGATVKKLGWA